MPKKISIVSTPNSPLVASPKPKKPPSARVLASQTLRKFMPIDLTACTIVDLQGICKDKLNRIRKAIINKKLIISFTYSSFYPEDDYDGLNMIVGAVDPAKPHQAPQYFLFHTEVMRVPFTLQTDAYDWQGLFRKAMVCILVF